MGFCGDGGATLRGTGPEDRGLGTGDWGPGTEDQISYFENTVN